MFRSSRSASSGPRRHRTRRAAVLGVASVAAAAGLTTAASPASAAPVLTVAYDVNGTSTVAKTNSSIALGPTTLTTALNADGTFTGSMPLPPTSTSFRALGLLPVTANVDFTEVGELSGVLKANPLPMVSATAQYVIRLSNVKVAGLPAFVGQHCQTASPVSIPVATPAGQSFDVMNGGQVTGTYTIGNFGHCGLTTGLINLLVPGSGNSVSLTLSNGRRVS